MLIWNHLHDGNLYEVIKIHAYGSKKTELELCECCIRKMWNLKSWYPETKILLEGIMKELKIYDN